MAGFLTHLSALVVLLLCFLVRDSKTQVPDACRWKLIERDQHVTASGISGQLSSPRLPGVSGHPQNLDCAWRIRAANTMKRIQLIIDYIDLPPREPDGKCNGDYLSIQDLSGERHWTFCGQEKKTCLISSGGGFRVNFVTSAKPNKKLRHFRGWTIRYFTVDSSAGCPVAPTPDAPLTTPPVDQEKKSTKSAGMTSDSFPTDAICEGPGCSANLSGGSSNAVVIFLSLTVLLLCLAGAACFSWWCWTRRRRREKRQRSGEEQGPSVPHPDVITFRVGEEKTSLMDTNYGKPVAPSSSKPSPNYGKPVSPSPSIHSQKTADYPFPGKEDAELKRQQEPLLGKDGHLKEQEVETGHSILPSGRYVLQPASAKGVVITDVTPYGYSDVLPRDRSQTQQPYPDPGYAEIDEGIVKAPANVTDRKDGKTAVPTKPSRGTSYPPYATVYKPKKLEAPEKPKRATPQKSPRKSANSKPDVVGDASRPSSDSSDYYEVPMVTAPPRKPPRSFTLPKAGKKFPRLSDESDDGYAVPIGTVTPLDHSEGNYDQLGGNRCHGNSQDGDYDHLGIGSDDYDHLSRGMGDQRKQRGQMSDYDRLPTHDTD